MDTYHATRAILALVRRDPDDDPQSLQEAGAALIADTLNDLHYLVNAFDGNAARRNESKLKTRKRAPARRPRRPRRG